MSNKKNKIKPVIVSVINQVKKKNEDFFSKLSSAAKRDQSYLRQVLKGKRNFTMCPRYPRIDPLALLEN